MKNNYNKYNEYKNSISDCLAEVREKINGELNEILDRIRSMDSSMNSSMDSSKYSVDILEVQNLIDEEHKFEFIWHSEEGRRRLDESTIGLGDLKKSIIEALEKRIILEREY